MSDQPADLSSAEQALLGQRLREAAPSYDRFDASFLQERLWFLSQWEGMGSAYNVVSAHHLLGPLRVDLLQKCLHEILRRHESLRTVFAFVDGRLCQVVIPFLAACLPIVDLCHLPVETRRAEARLRIAEQAREPFDLARGPLWRLALVKLDELEHIFTLAMHHTISDVWSQGVMLNEVSLLYEAFANGKPSPLPELAIQYADYAHWQRQSLTGERLERDLSYWRTCLGGDLPTLALPTDHRRRSQRGSHGSLESATFDASVATGLRRLGREQGATLFMTLLAVFKALLIRYTDQREVVVGCPVMNRSRLELEAVIGPFVNTLVLRTDGSGDPPFTELLRRVRDVTLEATAHQEVPFEKVVQVLQPARDLSLSPLFQVMFAFQQSMAGMLRLPSIKTSCEAIHGGASRFDLTLHLEEREDDLHATIEYDRDLFEPATIKRMLMHFGMVASAVAARSKQRISELPILSDEERRQLTVQWNDTADPMRSGVCFHQLVEVDARQRPDAVAVAWADHHLTYGELDARANRLAEVLCGLEVEPEVRVAACLERSPDAVVTILAIWKAGGVYVPLDATYPKERLAFMLRDARVAVVVTREEFLDRLPRHGAETVLLDHLPVPRRARMGTVGQRAASPENLAYVIYTSGSTGTPKGVQISHRGLSNLADAQIAAFDMTSADRVLQFASLSFDASIFELVMALRAGGVLCVTSAEAALPGAAMTRMWCEQEVTTVVLPPSVLASLERSGLPSLETIIVAGEACPKDLVEKWATGPRFVNAYGPTETTVWASYRDCVTTDQPSLGKPIRNTTMHLVDRYQQLVPLGVAGEIHIGGIGLARGYLQRPDLTADRFVPDPFSGKPGDRLYRTGDIARRLPSGDIDFLGRADGQVKIRGHRIELGEIEAALRRESSVLQAIVIGRDAVPGDKRLWAYIVPRNRQHPSIADMRGLLKSLLPEFMIPAHFQWLDELPLLPNGKVDLRRLPLPGPKPLPEDRLVAPNTKLEEVIAAIWKDLLQLAEVGTHHNFFDLGGHSLLMTRVQIRLKQELGIEVSMIDLFQYPTISSLACHLSRGDSQGLSDEKGMARADQRRAAMRRRRDGGRPQ